MPLIELHGRPPRPLAELQKGQLRHGIELYQAALQIHPENWAVMWLIGKCHQRLLEHDAAYEWFSRAHQLNPVQPDVAREAALSAMYLGRAEEAIAFCTTAIDAKPADPGLRANLALALLLSGAVEEAQTACEDALRRDPKDAITARLVLLCKSVRAGERPCPRRLSELQ
jgi:tetratricopeptide (TPR) repeat protein